MNCREALVLLGRSGKLMWEDFGHLDTAEFFHLVLGGYDPDLTSPKDVGCLLALLREADPDAEYHIGPSHPWMWMVYRMEIDASPCDGPIWLETDGYADTEGEAIAAALIALAADLLHPDWALSRIPTSPVSR